MMHGKSIRLLEEKYGDITVQCKTEAVDRMIIDVVILHTSPCISLPCFAPSRPSAAIRYCKLTTASAKKAAHLSTLQFCLPIACDPATPHQRPDCVLQRLPFLGDKFCSIPCSLLHYRRCLCCLECITSNRWYSMLASATICSLKTSLRHIYP